MRAGFRELEPDNGWGTVGGFKRALDYCLRAAREGLDEVWGAHR